MKKIKVHGLHETTINYDYVQYFYKCEGFTENGLPKWRVFVIDPDSKVYEVMLRCYEIHIDDELQELFENQQ